MNARMQPFSWKDYKPEDLDPALVAEMTTLASKLIGPDGPYMEDAHDHSSRCQMPITLTKINVTRDNQENDSSDSEIRRESYPSLTFHNEEFPRDGNWGALELLLYHDYIDVSIGFSSDGAEEGTLDREECRNDEEVAAFDRFLAIGRELVKRAFP